MLDISKYSSETYSFEVSDEDTQMMSKEISEVLTSLESYIEAFQLVSFLDKKEVLSMESFSEIMSLADKNCNVVDIKNVSLEGESKTSMIKLIVDKIKSLFSILMEKMKNLLSSAFNKCQNSTKKIKEALAKIKEKEKEISQEGIMDLFKKKPISAENVYLLVDKNGSIYNPQKMFDDLISINNKVCADAINFIGNAITDYEKSFRIDVENDSFGYKGFNVKEAEGFKKTIESIGKEKIKTDFSTFYKPSNLNAFLSFDFDAEKKTAIRCGIISELSLIKDIGYKIPNNELVYEKINPIFATSALTAMDKNVKAMEKYNNEMKDHSINLLNRMSNATVKTLFNSKNELSDSEYDDYLSSVKREIIKPISVVFNMVPDFFDLEAKFYDQLAQLM